MNEKEMRAMITALKLDALETLLHDEPRGNEADAISAWFDILRKTAIVGEIQIIHVPPGNGLGALTAIETGRQTIYLDGHHGKPGRALAIVVSLEEEGWSR